MKRICFICCVCVISITIAYVNKPDFKIVDTMAVPVSNKVIVIDAGHGTPDERC